MDCEDVSDERDCHKLSGNVNCSVNNGGCSQTCTGLSDSGYYCSCQEGYKIAVNDRKSCEDVDECARWGTYCTQQCKNVKGSYKCLCTDGFHDVKGKGTHCKPKGGQLLIFFTSGHEVRQVIPDKKAYSGTLSWGRHMGALDVDVDRRLLYFSGLSLMKIERAGIPDDIKDGGPPRLKDLNADVTQVEGIVIDWVTKELYKCCVSHLMADSLHLQDTTQPYSPGIPGSPEGGVAFTTFSNPMYFKEDKGEKSSPPPSPVTTKSGGDGSHDNPTFDDVNFNGDST